MINSNTRQLNSQLAKASRALKSPRSVEEKIALANYIGNLYVLLACLGEKDFFVDGKSLFGSQKAFNKFVKKIDVYSNRELQNFVVNREFHQGFLSDILPDVEDELIKVASINFDKKSVFSKKDFLEILYEFFRSINLTSFFERLRKGGHIYSVPVETGTDKTGCILYNPVSKDADVFIKRFGYNMRSLDTLVHEVGHVFDYDNFDGSVGDYNSYFYLSFFSETISLLFERLLFHFLIKNGICVEDAKARLLNFEELNHDNLIQAYMLSSLDNSFLLSGDYLKCSNSEFAARVKEKFLDDFDVEEFIEDVGDFDLHDIYNYVYGNILSLFLCDDIERDGFSLDVFDYFFKHRPELFSEEFMRMGNFSSEQYVKLYKKEIKLIKK